jgi:hypothetical protein
MRRSAATHTIVQPQRLRHFALIDVEHHWSVKDPEANCLAGHVAQALKLWLGGAAKVEIVPDRVSPLEEPRRKAVYLVPTVETEKTLLDKRLQQAMQCALRQQRLVQKVREAKAARLGGNRLDDLDPAGQRLDARNTVDVRSCSVPVRRIDAQVGLGHSLSCSENVATLDQADILELSSMSISN